MPRHHSALSSKLPSIKFDFNDPKFRPNFAQVAELIVRSPPPWLPAFLEWSAQDLRADRILESSRQTKAQTKGRLASLRNAARLILRELDSYPFRDFLEMEPLGLIRDTPSLRLALRDIEDRAVRSAALPIFTKETGETRSGREKALAPDHVSARVLCAARTAELWLFFHNVEPGPKGPRAQRVAQAYWLASGGPFKSSGNPLNGWADPFRKVRSKANAKALKLARATFRTSLSQTAAKGKPPWYLGTYFPVEDPTIKAHGQKS
jgi:hypothetical protein